MSNQAKTLAIGVLLGVCACLVGQYLSAPPVAGAATERAAEGQYQIIHIPTSPFGSFKACIFDQQTGSVYVLVPKGFAQGKNTHRDGYAMMRLFTGPIRPKQPAR